MIGEARQAAARPRLRRRAVFGAVSAAALLYFALAAIAQAPGDVNCDGRIDSADTHLLAHALFRALPGCVVAEVNQDGRTSAGDLTAAVRALASPPASGARISYLGIAGANGSPLAGLGAIGETPVFFRNSGVGFRIVIEAARGFNGVPPGRKTFDFDPTNPSRRPDLQIGCTAPLGDGSPAICADGVPAVPPPHFGGSQKVADSLNDLACNFDVITSPRFACTIDRFQAPSFLDPSTELQFCLQVTSRLQFPAGDTLCSVRLRDEGGTLGPLRQFVLRVDSGPVPPTFTPTLLATSTPTSTPRPTSTATARPTSSPTPTLPPTATPSATRESPPFTPTIGATSTRTPTATAPTAQPTATRTASQTPTATAPEGVTPSATPTRTRTPTVTPTRTTTLTPTRTRSPTPSASASPSRSPTPASPQGPVVTFFGLARPDEALIAPSGTTPAGIPVYTRPFGSGFRIVVEGGLGPSFEEIGASSFSFGGSSFPDLQIQANRPLGNGSLAVCDREGSTAGGVPAVDPPSFQQTPFILGAINDLSCRFVDGGGAFRGRQSSSDSCVQNPPDSGVFAFVHPSTRIQFCALVDLAYAFPPGDTVVTVRLRDTAGNVGVPRQIVVRVGQ